VREIQRRTRRRFSAEEKVRIVLEEIAAVLVAEAAEAEVVEHEEAVRAAPRATFAAKSLISAIRKRPDAAYVLDR